MVTVLRNARLVTDGQLLEDKDVLVQDGIILDVVPTGFSQGQVQDLDGDYLSPGWIDLHCHGAGGDEFIDADPDGIKRICDIHAAHGGRVLYPTISAANFQTIWNALEALEAVQHDCSLEIPGVHLEGPYLATSMCGAQDCSFITAPIRKDYTALMERFGSLISRWTYAPERDNGQFLKELTNRGIVPSMGHSAAEYNDVIGAFHGGCKLVTHLYSCTSSIIRKGGFRHLGITETAYLLDDMYVEAIGDGCHLPPELMRLIVKQKGPEHVCLITDAIRCAGMSDAENLVSGTKNVPYLIEDGVAKLMDRSAFAGSIATPDVLLQRNVNAGIPLPDVIRMMTETPAKAMSLHNKGRIAPGYHAQFTRFTAELECKSL